MFSEKVGAEAAKSHTFISKCLRFGVYIYFVRINTYKKIHK